MDSCPLNKTDFTAAATRLNCSVDKHGRNQYTCVPKFDLTAIVEFCCNSTVEMYPKGHCLWAVGNGHLNSINCSQFTEGCPKDHYRGNELYRFPACSQINTEQRCFYADPSCPNETRTFTTEDGNISPTTLINALNTTTNISSTLTTPREQGFVDVGVIIGSVLSVVIVLGILLAVVIWRCRRRIYSSLPAVIVCRWRQKRKRRRRYSSVPVKEIELDERRSIGEDQELPEYSRDPTLPEWKSDCITHRLGEYNIWRTPISDQFSSLSNDEVYVLFCFLCSDFGTPDFTDTDWLDILNEILEMDYEDSVTSEEAQRILDGLKSRGFLWNRDGVDITEYVKDETMYRVTEPSVERFIKLSGNISVTLPTVYSLSSYTTAVRYLRLERYTRKSREKCVISNYPPCDTLLIHRLQMNVLTHVTMEDTGICNEVSRYLNIPLNKVRMSEGERGAFLEDLQKIGECVQYRGGSQGSVQHVKWLWRYDVKARPDIVRSCIGLHPHWDIYIINNTAYRKHSQYHDCPPAERCLLYCLLMVDDYTAKVKDESHIKMYNVIRERCFTELPVCKEITAANNHGGIIHVENDVIKFKSDDILHDVMYAFVTECLVEESDLKFFLTTASHRVISEYCRLWDYERSEGERCLYIPDRPDEMYDLFIYGMQLDILIHSAMSDRGIHHRISKRCKYLSQNTLKFY
ncbi:uncharacterized protein LOC130053659 [Ostrea edulis]|uniref:uncharacterized protein LOC130053659 n=1 Tax=Ostrea edulis TaxID=37623 RepID=UPI0024AEC4D0|nr:uncharacterized protein LOC130053659 [Ostrea edulis]